MKQMSTYVSSFLPPAGTNKVKLTIEKEVSPGSAFVASIRRVLLLVCCCIAVSSIAMAQWSTDPTVNNAISTAPGGQTLPAIVSDGAGGAIICWQDNRSGDNDIYAQRIDAAGVTRWTTDGVAVCAEPGDQSSPVIVSDNLGGAIITWVDSRGGSADIYAQRINSAGLAKWASDGIVVCDAANVQNQPTITSDGSNGAVIAWRDYRNGTESDIYAGRINANGVAKWTSDGMAVCMAAGNQDSPGLLANGSGGAIIAWYDHRSGDDVLYTQAINGTGAANWSPNGIALGTAIRGQYAQFPTMPGITTDGAGGAIFTWYGYRGSFSGIYAQRISASGILQWTVNGITISTASYDQIDPMITPDGSGGAILCWSSFDDFSFAISVQRINGEGLAQWTPNGEIISTNPFPGSTEIIPDQVGGAIVTWRSNANPQGSRVSAQRVDATGTALWQPGGLDVANGGGSQIERRAHKITSDGGEGAIITWQVYNRNSFGTDIYAQHVNPDGNLGTCISPAITDEPLPAQTVCINTTPADLTVTATGNNISYQWYRDTDNAHFDGTAIAGATGHSFTPPVGAAGTFYYYVSVINSCNTIESDYATVVVGPPPPCSIGITSGGNCPSSVNVYTAPAGLSTYSWGVSGNASIASANDLANVDVLTGSTCNSPFTLILNVTNNNGCRSLCTASTNVFDRYPPALTGKPYPGNLAVNACRDNAVASAPFNATYALQGYTDDCDKALKATLTNTSVTGTNSGWTVTYTFTVTDGCGNALTGQSYKNTGRDRTEPVISNTPKNITTCSSVVTWPAPTATDNCQLKIFRSNHYPGETFPPGSTLVTYYAQDASGNTATYSFTVTVGAPATPKVSVTNNCGTSTLTASCYTGSLLWSNGATTASITVTNCATYTVTQTVNGCTSRKGSGMSAPRATPQKPNVSVVNNCGSSTLTAKGYTGSLLWSNGASTASITVTNNATYTVTQTINGCRSAAGSGISAPKKVTITALDINAYTSSNNCSASVIFGQNVTISGTPGSALVYKIGTLVIKSPYVFQAGTTTVTVTATNSCGSVTRAFLVKVTDKQVPVIACKPGATRTCTSSSYTVAGTEFNATASDNCGTPSLCYRLSGATVSAYSVTNVSLAGKKLNVGTTIITWKATDASNNISTCSTTVKVNKVNSAARSSILSTDINTYPQLAVQVLSNPTTNYFTLLVKSERKEKIYMTVVDMLGKTVEYKMSIAPNSTLQLGSRYMAGMYIAELIQGKERVQAKLVKLK